MQTNNDWVVSCDLCDYHRLCPTLDEAADYRWLHERFTRHETTNIDAMV